MHSAAEQLATLRAQIRAAEERAGRPAESCALLAVSKGVSAERVAEVIAHLVTRGATRPDDRSPAGR